MRWTALTSFSRTCRTAWDLFLKRSLGTTINGTRDGSASPSRHRRSAPYWPRLLPPLIDRIKWKRLAIAVSAVLAAANVLCDVVLDARFRDRCHHAGRNRRRGDGFSTGRGGCVSRTHWSSCDAAADWAKRGVQSRRETWSPRVLLGNGRTFCCWAMFILVAGMAAASRRRCRHVHSRGRNRPRTGPRGGRWWRARPRSPQCPRPVPGPANLHFYRVGSPLISLRQCGPCCHWSARSPATASRAGQWS